ncbi:hypothetical protein JOD54_000273 [Actinokineospora baliensis]|uniref:hypothetical protein n=1 Tax=Actinokineospora baliensis TaxID=547056 RepID=UPI001956B8C1|nr:hypothetical protein [Actinokineospora baliensis]MBM7770069.1 hypothetical protein [Actinokineospora baliensis]
MPETTTSRFTARSALPGALLLVLFGICLVLVVTAPTREYEQIHDVAVNNGQDNWVTLPRAALSCVQVGLVETCVVDVVGRPLEVAMTRPATETGAISCTARYGGKPRMCEATFAYGPSGDGAAARLPAGIGLSNAEIDRLADEWPRVSLPAGLEWVPLAATGALALLAALVAGFGGRRPTDEWRAVVWTTGLGWLVLMVFAIALLGGTIDAIAHPANALVGVLLMFWQWTLTRPGYRYGIGRALGAFAVTAVATGAALFTFLVAGSFIA